MARGGSRPGSGRRPKAPELKKLAGTDRADRQRQLPAQVTGGAMIAPLHLSDLARLHFSSIAEVLETEGRANPHFAEHVALLALRLEQIQRFNAVLETEGDTYKTESAKKVGDDTIITRLIRARPEVAMLSDAMRQAQSLISELMLNPAASLRIAAGHAPEAGAFDDF